ncbi:LPXTG cell wall anchor domain-containing protein [Staphylococcus casei]|uniref:LPXTG cell wall anchor domain-containing protein n=1 Tax=Staphylococcus casei TaxID=201828 RepID=A0ABZ2WBY0_9STAP
MEGLASQKSITNTTSNMKGVNTSTTVNYNPSITEAENSNTSINTLQTKDEDKKLPNTGENDSNTTVWSSLLLLIGSTLIFFRKNKREVK